MYIKYKTIHEHIHSYTLFSSFILYIFVSVLGRVLFCVSASVSFFPYLLRRPVLSPQRSRSNSWMTLGWERHVFSHIILELIRLSVWHTLNVLFYCCLEKERIRSHYIPTESHPYISNLWRFHIWSAGAVFHRVSRESRLSQLPRSLLLFCCSMMVANSSPLPNIDHTMCLMLRGGLRGWVGGWGSHNCFTQEVCQTYGNDFLVHCASRMCGCPSTGMSSRMRSVL